MQDHICHCGADTWTNDVGQDRGMCEDCDLVRCDVDPTECPNKGIMVRRVCDVCTYAVTGQKRRDGILYEHGPRWNARCESKSYTQIIYRPSQGTLKGKQ